MPVQTDARARLDDALSALATAGVSPVVLSRPAARPVAELLVRRRQWRAAVTAVENLDWRWCFGGVGAWRLVGPTALVFDSGAVLVLHRRLPSAQWAPWRLSRLSRVLTTGRAPAAAAEVVFAALAAGRSGFRDPAELAALRDLAEPVDPAQVERLARHTGIWPAVHAALTAATNGGREQPSIPVTAVDRAAKALRRRATPRRLRPLASADPIGRSVARCRFAGIEVRAGPGVFLPRGASEQLVMAAAAVLAPTTAATIVDVGTGCGAAALALATRFRSARVVGTELDPAAVRWADRNAALLRRPDVGFVAGSLLDPLPPELMGQVDVVLANVPCVRAEDLSDQVDAPDAAYAGEGADALGLQRTLARQACRVLRPGGHLLVQLAAGQVETYLRDLAELGYAAKVASRDEVAVVVRGRLSGDPVAGSAGLHEEVDEGR